MFAAQLCIFSITLLILFGPFAVAEIRIVQGSVAPETKMCNVQTRLGLGAKGVRRVATKKMTGKEGPVFGTSRCLKSPFCKAQHRCGTSLAKPNRSWTLGSATYELSEGCRRRSKMLQ